MDRVRKKAIEFLREEAESYREVARDRESESDHEGAEVKFSDALDLDGIANLIELDTQEGDNLASRQARRLDTAIREDIDEGVYGFLELCGEV